MKKVDDCQTRHGGDVSLSNPGFGRSMTEKGGTMNIKRLVVAPAPTMCALGHPRARGMAMEALGTADAGNGAAIDNDEVIGAAPGQFPKKGRE